MNLKVKYQYQERLETKRRFSVAGLASQWLMDLIAFLRSIFESFTNLPSRLAGMACMSSCQHLARSIMNLLMDENIKAASNGALQQMDLDLVQCEMFASSEPVPGLEEGVLVMCFLDLRLGLFRGSQSIVISFF